MRAIEHLHDANPEIKKEAKDIHSSTLEHLRRILRDPPHVFKKEVSKESQKGLSYLGKMVQLWMKKEEHDKPLTTKDLEKLDVRFKYVPQDIIDKTKNLINECQKELVEENKRFVIQTSKIENERYLGGYFYS